MGRDRGGGGTWCQGESVWEYREIVARSCHLSVERRGVTAPARRPFMMDVYSEADCIPPMVPIMSDAAASSSSAHAQEHNFQPLRPIGARRSGPYVEIVEPAPAAPGSPAQEDPADASPDSEPVTVSPGTVAAAAATTTEIARKTYEDSSQALADARDQASEASVAVEYMKKMCELAVSQKNLKESELNIAKERLERALAAAAAAKEEHEEAAKQEELVRIQRFGCPFDSDVDGRP